MKGNRKTQRAARQLFRLCRVDGRVDGDRVRLIARRLAESKRRGAIALLASLQRMVRLERDRHSAVVESAISLPDDVREEIRADLSRLYGPGLELSFAQNADLIGGTRIRIGSDVYDSTVRARLTALEARL